MTEQPTFQDMVDSLAQRAKDTGIIEHTPNEARDVTSTEYCARDRNGRVWSVYATTDRDKVKVGDDTGRTLMRRTVRTITSEWEPADD